MVLCIKFWSALWTSGVLDALVSGHQAVDGVMLGPPGEYGLYCTLFIELAVSIIAMPTKYPNNAPFINESSSTCRGTSFKAAACARAIVPSSPLPPPWFAGVYRLMPHFFGHLQSLMLEFKTIKTTASTLSISLSDFPDLVFLIQQHLFPQPVVRHHDGSVAPARHA